MRKKITNVCFGPLIQIATISNFPSGAPTVSALQSHSQAREAVAGNVNSCKGRLYAINGLLLLLFLVNTQMNYMQIIVVWNICYICRVLSARAVGRAWTGNSRTDNPSNRFYAQMGTFPLQWIKTVFFCILTIAPLMMIEKIAYSVHFTDPVSDRCQTTISLIHSDQFFLHF